MNMNQKWLAVRVSVGNDVEEIPCKLVSHDLATGYHCCVELLQEGRSYRKGARIFCNQPDLVSLAPAVNFFMEHAGFATPPGQEQCAYNLAAAELHARQNGFSFEWSADPEGCSMCDSCSKHVQAGAVVEQCLCRSQNGSVVASLCGICNASKEYRRVVEAELASEVGA